MFRRCTRLAPLALAAVLAACGTLPPLPNGAAVQLSGVPAYAQDELQCGPAALASALNASGVEVRPEQLREALFIPARGGSLQVELLAQTRRHQRLPMQLAPDEASLLSALRDGQPPLVLLNLGVRSYPYWHYAVVTGYDPEQGYRLHDGRAEPSLVGRRRFLRQWQWAGQWAISIHRADQLPASAQTERWIAAAAPFERQAPALAEQAYRAALARWPDRALVQAAWGAQRLAAGEPEVAVQALRRARQLDPGNAAYANNLASAELARGCPAEAASALAAVGEGPWPPALAGALAATRAEIAAAAPRVCSPLLTE